MNVRSDRWHRRVAIAQACAYVVIVLAGLAGALRFQHDAARICDTAESNRQAVRNLVVGVKRLGRELVVGGPDAAAPSPEQRAALAQFKAFKQRQFELTADPACD